MNPEDQVISRFNLYKGRYCLFAGAGVSVCAGIPLATVDLPGLPSIVSCVRKDFYDSLGKPNLSEKELLSWYEDQKLLQQPETFYSDALNLIGDTPRSRQNYLRRFFEGRKPGVCHQSIARLIELGHLDLVFTTNFDSLIEDAIRGNNNCSKPKVAAHSEPVADILLTEPGPKVIKLHGDYLFSDIKNTTEETEKLTKNMRDKLRSILHERGLVVVGYSGGDNSIMAILEQMAFDGNYFPYGLYWMHLKDCFPRDRVGSFVKRVGGRLNAIESADYFLGELSRRLEAVK